MNAAGDARGTALARRAEGLAAAARTHRDVLLESAEPVAARRDVVVEAAPVPGTVMTVLATPAGQQCVTEVVVTTASVRVGGIPGWACVLGWDAEAALAAALLDAADPVLADRLADEAICAEQMERARLRARIIRTRMGTE